MHKFWGEWLKTSAPTKVDTAQFIGAHAVECMRLANEVELETISFLLSMVVEEATAVTRQLRRAQ